jgi:hypothetical protein
MRTGQSNYYYKGSTHVGGNFSLTCTNNAKQKNMWKYSYDLEPMLNHELNLQVPMVLTTFQLFLGALCSTLVNSDAFEFH